MPGSLSALQAGATVTTTKNDALLVDIDSDGEADPGDTLRYTVVVTNTGGVDALGLTVTDTLDLYTSLVTDSLRVTPLARDDAYDAIGNTRIIITATNGLLANDVDPDDPAPNPAFNDNLTVTGFDVTSANGGVVNVDDDGGFTYDPPLNFEGADTFTYTVEDAHGQSAEATVTITVSEMVWYVDNSAPPDGDGRSHSPFNSLANSVGGANDIIFINESGGGNYEATLTLQNGQQLVGQDFGPDDFATVTGLPATLGAAFPTADASPTITSSGDAITLANNNSVHGLTVGNTSGAGLVGTNFGSLTVRDVTINGAGTILDLDSGAVDASFDALTTTGSATFGVSLTGLSGSLSAGSGSIAGVSGVPFDVNGGTATVTYPGNMSKNSSGRLVQVLNRPGAAGNITFSGNLTCNSACTGINVASNSGGTILFSGSSKVLNTGGNAAVTLNSNGGATITFGNGGLDVDTTSGMGFNATGGGIVNVMGSGNTIDSTTGIAVNIANTTIGSGGVTVESISVNGATSGIVLNNTGNSGGLTVTGDGSLANNASGGMIQNTISHGIAATNTQDLSLTAIHIENPGDNTSEHGILATDLRGSSLLRASTIANFNQASGDGFRVVNHNVNLTELRINNSTFTNSDGNDALAVFSQGNSVMTIIVENESLFTNLEGDAIDVIAGDLMGSTAMVTLIVDENNFTNAGTTGNGGIQARAANSGTLTGSITNNTFNDTHRLASTAGVIEIQGNNSGTVDLTVSGNDLDDFNQSGINVVADDASDVAVVLDGNMIDTSSDDRIGIRASIRNTGATRLVIENNQIGQTTAMPGSAGTRSPIDIEVFSDTGPADDVRILIDNNQLRANKSSGTSEVLDVFIDDNADAHVTMTNNTLTNIDSGDAAEIITSEGAITGTTLCLDLRSNTAINPGPTNGDIELIELEGTFFVEDLAGVGTANPNANIVFDPNMAAFDSAAECLSPTVASITVGETVVHTESETAVATNNSVMQSEFAALTLPLKIDTPAVQFRPHPIVLARILTTPALMPPAATPGDTLTLLGDPFTLGAGETITLTFDVEIAGAPPPGVTSVQNQAGVSGDNFTTVLSADPAPDPSFPPTDGETITPLDLEADVAIAKADDPDPATAGQPLTYTITISNAGPNAASDLTVTDNLPAEFNYVSDSCGGALAGGPPGGVWTWTAAGLEANSSLPCVITGTVAAGFSGMMTNTASVTALTPDPAPANNTIMETTTVTDNVFSIDDVAQAEGDSGVTTFSFTVARSNNATAASVDVATSDVTGLAGEDYTALPPTTVNFTAGGGLTQTVNVEVHGDAIVELDETFVVSLSNPVNGAIGDGEGQGTIENDDSAALSIDDVSQAEGDSGTTVFTFTVTLSAAVDSALSVDFATVDGTATAPGDYVANSGTLNFDGAAGETRTIAVSVNGDTIEEDDETFTVELNNLAASGRDVSLAGAEGQGIILDDDGEGDMHIYWFPIAANYYESIP